MSDAANKLDDLRDLASENKALSISSHKTLLGLSGCNTYVQVSWVSYECYIPL